MAPSLLPERLQCLFAHGDFLEAFRELSERVFDRKAFEAGRADEADAIRAFVDVGRVIRRGDGATVAEEDDVFADLLGALDDGLAASDCY